MAHLLEKTRKITSILKRSDEQLQEELPYNAITRQLADIIDCNACIVNSKGRLLGYFMRYKTNTDRVEQFFQTKIFPDDYIRSANLIYDTEANLPVEHELSIFPIETQAEFPDGLTTIAPIHVSGIRLGSLIIWRNDKEFDDELDFKIVGSTEADSLAGKISNESPLGKALLGKKIGETAVVETLAGVSEYMVLEIQRVS